MWQETHTAHAFQQEAIDLMYEALESYRLIAEEILAIPVVTGIKSESEKFAGAVMTTTIEALMPDGKALQSGTSHHLGQNFSKKSAFNISFQNNKDQTEYAWQNSWGLSTRIIGALIMTHGDDDGIVLPPKVAPIQVLIASASQEKNIIDKINEIKVELLENNIRVATDISSKTSLGWKLNDAELTGIPIVIIIGKQELENNNITLNIRFSKTKKVISKDNLSNSIKTNLEIIQKEMLQKAKEKNKEITFEVNSYDTFKNIMKNSRGFIKAFWCEDKECEEMIKKETKATTRCLPFTDKNGSIKEESGVCIKCGKKATHRWLFAQAY